MTSAYVCDVKIFKMFFACLYLVIVASSTGLQDEESCVDENTQAAGRCKSLKECEIAKHDFLASGNKPTFCTSKESGQILVCCKDASNTTTDDQKRTESRPIWGNIQQQDKRRVSERKCEEYSSDVVQTVEYIALIPSPNLPILPFNCDYEYLPLIGGDNAEHREYPHMAAIGWVDSNTKYKFLCGGSLISPKFVLTAAQCVSQSNSKDPEPAIVRLGDQNLDDSVDDGASPIDVPIRRIHRHPEYKIPKLYNDIALLELANDVTFDTHIRAACLWMKPTFQKFRIAVTTGWGESITSNNKTSKELKRVVLSLMENEYCETLLSGVIPWQDLIDTQVCAEKLTAQDACQGDTGSPLQVALKERPCIFYIIGVTSRPRTCAENHRPSVYTRVSSYLDWIEKIVWPGE